MKLNIELYLKVDFIGKRTGRVITGMGKETYGFPSFSRSTNLLSRATQKVTHFLLCSRQSLPRVGALSDDRIASVCPWSSTHLARSSMFKIS